MATPRKGMKKEKKKPIPVKTSLNNPYDLKWTPLEKGHAGFILKTVKEKIDTLGLKKRRVSVVRKWQKRKTTDEPTTSPSGPGESSQQIKCIEATTAPGSWTDRDMRKQLAIGINEVTKGLERNELSLLMVCSSVKPSHMTSHLIPLSKTRSVPACQLPGLSKTISGCLGLDSVLALGFKRGADKFADTVDAIAPKVPRLDVAWVPTERKLFGRKRKLSTEAAEAPEVLLQPLKVKKIIPNPSKIRKTKRTKTKQKRTPMA
uniref:Ribosomal protein eL8/eL30/eS12/Gadd45 domain-containing protein n=1 Tax=Electrophorus electricus TaxID=8005 RepID=A0A4W4E6I0_ELEEL